jgi:hypothetical protein
MKPLAKTLAFTLILCLVTITVAFSVQIRAESAVEKCSYLDPITVDILAFIAALFLVTEGLYKIINHPKLALKYQLTRSIRVAFGCSILTLHIMQFLHK